MAGTHTCPHICVEHLFCRGAAEARTALAMVRQVIELTGLQVFTHVRSVHYLFACTAVQSLVPPAPAAQAHRGAGVHSTSTMLGSAGGAVAPATKCVACRVCSWSRRHVYHMCG